MKRLEQFAPQLLKREVKQAAPKIIKREIGHIAPKVLKAVTPWYIRWFYSIFSDRIKMAATSIAPDEVTTSDSVVRLPFSLFPYTIIFTRK